MYQTLKEVPKGFSPYFTLVGRAQTINESNEFDDFVVKACALAADQVGNAVLLNWLGFSHNDEVPWRKKQSPLIY